MILIFFFGFPRATSQKKPVRLSNKALALLAYLSIEGRTSRRQLATLFWSANQDGLNNLSVIRGEIINALGKQALEADNATLGLGDVQSDLLEWQTSQDPQKRWMLAEHEFLQDLRFRDWQWGGGGEFEEWLETQRRRFASERCRLAFEIAQRKLQQGLLRPALPWLEKAALDKHEPSEEAARWWVLALTALNEKALCHKAIDSFTQALTTAYEVKEAPKEVLLLASQATATSALGILKDEVAHGQQPNLQINTLPLFGRESEWQRMEIAWQSGKAILISGDLGIGKSRLALEFIQSKGSFWQMAGRPGDSFVPYATHARCFDQLLQSASELVLPDWVKLEMSRLIPAFGMSLAPVANDQDKLRFLEAQATTYQLASLVNQWQGVLFEDMQFADQASLKSVLYLNSKFLPYQSGFPRSIFVFQAEQLKPDIESGLRDWVRLGLAEWIELKPLTRKAVQSCLKSIDAKLEFYADQIMRLTGGNPLLMLEAAHALAAQGLHPGQLKASDLPKALEIAQARLGQLPSQALSLARLAAIAGQQFSSRLAEVALEWSWQRFNTTMEMLEQAKIMSEHQFTLELFHEAILEGISEAMKRSLHLQVLQTLEVIGAPAQILAFHAQGANQLEAAQQYNLEAALENTNEPLDKQPN